MEKQWVIKPQGQEQKVEELAKKLRVDCKTKADFEAYNIVANLLVIIGIDSFEDAKHFFRPSLKDLNDPFLMNDMDKAVERIFVAIQAHEKILVYGDYDVDGITAVALVYSYLQSFYSEIDYYIPDRYTEGYGVRKKGVDYASENDFKLIICLDCGIKDNENIAYAYSKGIDFIVADHHLPSNTLPEAYAVLDPKREDSTYPYNELSGCGIGFKLVCALHKSRGMDFDLLVPYLDLVTMSIASDVVPITGENRVLAYWGLKVINRKPRAAVQALLECANIIHSPWQEEQSLYFNREITINDLVFLIGPRINATGRIESGKEAVELLICKTIDCARKIAQVINATNDTRKELDNEITRQAKQQLFDSEDFLTSRATVVCNDNWHKGVIGIVASRLMDVCYRPTIVLSRSNGVITGSARSIKGFDIYNAIERCSDLLEHFGGHKAAAGLVLKSENLQAFTQRFKAIAQEEITGSIAPEVEIDMQITLNNITEKLFRILGQFAPFGQDNNIPIFCSEGLVDTGKAMVVGHNHLKLNAIHLEVRHVPFACIGFSLGEKYDIIKQGNPFKIVYQIDENSWQGKKQLQLNLKDIKEDNTNNE